MLCKQLHLLLVISLGTLTASLQQQKEASWSIDGGQKAMSVDSAANVIHQDEGQQNTCRRRRGDEWKSTAFTQGDVLRKMCHACHVKNKLSDALKSACYDVASSSDDQDIQLKSNRRREGNCIHPGVQRLEKNDCEETIQTNPSDTGDDMIKMCACIQNMLGWCTNMELVRKEVCGCKGFCRNFRNKEMAESCDATMLMSRSQSTGLGNKSHFDGDASDNTNDNLDTALADKCTG